MLALVKGANALYTLIDKPPYIPNLATLISDSRLHRQDITLENLKRCKNDSLLVSAWSPLDVKSMHNQSASLATECYKKICNMVVTPTATGQLPVGRYEADCVQLRFGRTSAFDGRHAPICSNHETKTCAVPTLPIDPSVTMSSLDGMAQTYLSSTEEDYFQKTGNAPIGPCLMCIRRDITNMVYIAFGAQTPQSSVNAMTITPPFTNEWNRPGGYREDSMLLSPHLKSAIVKFSAPTCIVYHVDTHTMGVDQSMLMWTPASEQRQCLN
jgi:hypothetical protein